MRAKAEILQPYLNGPVERFIMSDGKEQQGETGDDIIQHLDNDVIDPF